MNLEIKTELPDHRPIVIVAKGETAEELLDDAEWCYDVPDPVDFYCLGDLPGATFDRVRELIEEEYRDNVLNKMERT